jgi:hypothetical protein
MAPEKLGTCVHIPSRILPLTLPFFQPFAVKRALEVANTKAVDIDGIAFTRGPGEAITKTRKLILIVRV